LPPTERYFAGGSTTLRGFDLDEARPNGGQIIAIGNFEYRVPLRTLPIDGIGAALFYDTGNVFPTASDFSLKDFTHTAGFGLRYQTPIGPIRIDFGFNLKPRINQDGNREERVQVFFTLGNPF
jgi:outer membrane protein assembly factor BamA